MVAVAAAVFDIPDLLGDLSFLVFTNRHCENVKLFLREFRETLEQIDKKKIGLYKDSYFNFLLNNCEAIKS